MKTGSIVLRRSGLGIVLTAALTLPFATQAFASTAQAGDAASNAVERVTSGTQISADGTPDSLNQAVDLGHGASLRVAGSDAQRELINNRAVYANSATGASSVVQKVDNSTQVLTVIDGASSPSSYRFDLNLPAGDHLVSGPDGSVLISTTDNVIVGDIATPWAKDAKGVNLPTTYTIDGNSVTQNVNLEGAAFPVVADPRVTFGFYAYVTFTRSETTRIAPNSSYVTLTAAACGLIPLPGVNVACAIIVGAAAINLSNVFKNAASQNGKCAQMRFNYLIPGQVGSYAGASVVNC